MKICVQSTKEKPHRFFGVLLPWRNCEEKRHQILQDKLRGSRLPNAFFASYMIKNQKETPQEKTKSTPKSYRHCEPLFHIAHPFPSDQRPPAVSGGMEHEEQKDPVVFFNRHRCT